MMPLTTELRTRPEPRTLSRSALLRPFAAIARNVETDLSAWLAVLTFIYILTTVARAVKPFWFDEITTFYLARMDNVWAAWRLPADLQPPLMLALAHVSQRLVGATEIGTRMPAILGVFAACGCLFAFIRRRAGSVFALCGAMLILLTSAYHYAVEARPYGLVLAGAALALLSWQRVDEPRRSWLPLAGIALGLWIALASNCWAVLLAIPFGIGEIVRSARRGKIDWPVWCAFAVSATAVLFYPPLLHLHNNGFADKQPMFEPGIRTLWQIPSHMIGGAGRVIAVIMVLIAWLRSGEDQRADSRLRIPVHEMVAVLLLAAIPLFLQLSVAGLHSSIFYRYGLAAVLGMAILITQAFHRVAGGDVRIGAVILLLFCGVFVERFISDAFGRSDSQPPAKIMFSAARSEMPTGGHQLLSLAQGDLPIVVGNPLWYPPIAHYLPPQMSSRTYYLTDRAAAVHFAESDFFEGAIPIMVKYFLPGKTAPYSDFVATHRRFFVYTSSNGFDWIMGRLRADNPTFRFVGREGDALLLEACLQCETPLNP